MMRIDKFLVENGLCSRKEAKLAAKKKLIKVNGEIVKDSSMHIDETKDIVSFNDEDITYQKFIYVMLNKPQGYVSATEDNFNPYVCELLEERLQKIGLFPMGRLDKDTTGLMILTNNGPLAHNLLSPKHHVEKEYSFTVDNPLPANAETRIEKGLRVDKGLLCKPAKLIMNQDRKSGHIILTEGKYHEIKRMMITLGSEITSLQRETFASITLDRELQPGEYRYLTDEEIEILESNQGN